MNIWMYPAMPPVPLRSLERFALLERGHFFKDFKIVFTSTVIFFSYVHLDMFVWVFFFFFLHPLACLEHAFWLTGIPGKPPLYTHTHTHTRSWISIYLVKREPHSECLS